MFCPTAVETKATSTSAVRSTRSCFVTAQVLRFRSRRRRMGGRTEVLGFAVLRFRAVRCVAPATAQLLFIFLFGYFRLLGRLFSAPMLLLVRSPRTSFRCSQSDQHYPRAKKVDVPTPCANTSHAARGLEIKDRRHRKRYSMSCLSSAVWYGPELKGEKNQEQTWSREQEVSVTSRRLFAASSDAAC